MKPIVVSPTTSEKFQTSAKSSTPILMLYHATWCGHCVAFQPAWKDIKKELSITAGIIPAEVESEHIPLMPAALAGVRGFPTLMMLQDGKVVKEYSGNRSVSDVVSFAKKYAVASMKPKKEKPLKAKTTKKSKK